MAGQEVLILCVSVITAVLGAHMQGGSLSFRAREKYSNGWVVDLKYKTAFTGPSNRFSWYCNSGNCGSQLQNTITPIENRTSSPNIWYQNEGYMKRRVDIDKPFQLRESSCCWVSNVYSEGGWELSTTVDLGTRSDTKKPNTSPVTTIIPILRIPQNCATSIKLLAHDPDGDHVACRYGDSFGECGLCRQYFSVDQSRCIISFPSGRNTGSYVMEMVLEDFPNQNIQLTYYDRTVVYKNSPYHRKLENLMDIALHLELGSTPDFDITHPTLRPPVYSNPLSRIPLQFLIQVTSTAPTCGFGEYRPRFLSPTPIHGIKLRVNAGTKFQLHLTAHASYERIVDFKVSGLPGMTKSFKSVTQPDTMSMVVEWTPKEDNVGEHVPVCFVAETANRYQSELRCIVVAVGPSKLADTTLLCHDNTMTLIIAKSADSEINNVQLRLNDPKCLVSSNNTHLIASVAYNSCGTLIEETEENIVFKNTATSYDLSTVITRHNGISIPFNCSFPKKNRVSASFRAHKSDYVFTEAGFGNFTYKFQFFTDSRFVEVNTQSPLEVILKELLYMQIEVSSSVPNVQLFVESCRATPHDNPSDPVFYDIIQNGCIKDDTVVVYPASRTQYRFATEAFAFIGSYPEVYINCIVILCKTGATTTRCTQGCISKSMADSGNRRHRRSLISESQQHFISQGPVSMKRENPSDKGVEQTSAGYVNTVVIALSGMATVALISVTLSIYMKRARSAGYQRFRTQDY